MGKTKTGRSSSQPLSKPSSQKKQSRAQKQPPSSKDHIDTAILEENRNYEKCYLWLQEHMPPKFFEEVSEEDVALIAHSLMGFHLQDFFSRIHFKQAAIILCLDSQDADLKILKKYQNQGIKNYRAFVSNSPPPLPLLKAALRIAVIRFTTVVKEEDDKKASEKPLSPESKAEIKQLVKKHNPKMTDPDFAAFLKGMGARFLRGLTKERLAMAIDVFFRAQANDQCQYEVRYNKDWNKEKEEIPSVQIVLAWKNVPKQGFLYRLASTIYRHNLVMRRMSAAHIDAYSTHSILVMSIGLHGALGKAAWEVADMEDFLQELVTLKYFEGQPTLEQKFVESGWVSGNIGNLLKALSHFIHQTLTHADMNMYSLENIEEGLCRHPELTVKLTQAFAARFHPSLKNLEKYETLKKEYLSLVSDLDTGNQANDNRRKNILLQGMNFVSHVLKTNFYCQNKTAFSFRLDPAYLTLLPYDSKEKFPEIPFAIFFIKGMFFIGFHIRFKDLSRGGLRTVLPQKMEQMLWERNNVFAECYNLAYTQQKKNKDIPEGGAKGIIFLEPYERLHAEADIYTEEMRSADIAEEIIKTTLETYHKKQRLEYLYQSQRSFIEAFVTLINCEETGKLKASHVIDYFKKPEYIYLGPDENMHNEMLDWIANYAKEHRYKPGGSFISSKPSAGINHKEYGVTSLGVNVYVEEALKYIGIDPAVSSFKIKLSGGPDGDVAGNLISLLYKLYPKTAKLLSITDGSGTIYDPKGLDLSILNQLFKRGEPIRFYPPEKLSEGGYLLDLWTKKEQTAYAQQTLCWRVSKGKANKEWLSGSDMNHLYRHGLHQIKTDIFVTGGGRPKTLNETNYQDFLDREGKPTASAIVEGANLYLTPWARRALEKLGVIIIKDSSANKGGVICSSIEVLIGLILSEEEFIQKKKEFMPEVLQIIRQKAKNEATLLLATHKETGAYLTDISDWISEKINTFMYQILDFLEPRSLSKDQTDPLIRCLINYCPPFLRTKYKKKIIEQIPDIHKKAIIASYIASKIVYNRGLGWSPTIVDILPLISNDESIINP